MAEKTDITKELLWIRTNAEFLHFRSIARIIGFNHTSFTQWVSGKPDSRGYTVGLPEKCVDPLKKWIAEHCRY